MNNRVQLATLKKGGLSATEYFNKMKALADTLAIIGQPLKDEEFIAYLLAGLDESYDSLVTSVTTREINDIPLFELFAYMLSQESRIESRQYAPKVDEYYANFVNRGRAGRLCEEEAELAGQAQEVKATASTTTTTTSATTPLVAQAAPLGRRISAISVANWVTMM
jgi:hypothetical protein